VTGGFMMFVCSILLLVINRRLLPAPMRVRRYRVVALAWSGPALRRAVGPDVLRAGPEARGRVTLRV